MTSEPPRIFGATRRYWVFFVSLVLVMVVLLAISVIYKQDWIPWFVALLVPGGPWLANKLKWIGKDDLPPQDQSKR